MRTPVRFPVVQGIIRRRVLVNYRVAPEVMEAQLPKRFRPKLCGAHAIGGICLIRLEAIRPRHAPAVLGLSSENAAHRIAVTWEAESGSAKEGVFIPRRDTDSWITAASGGRLFPGEHHRASFTVVEDDRKLDVRMRSRDGEVDVRVVGRLGSQLPPGSAFRSLAEASAFFEKGSLGYSSTRDAARLDGMELRTQDWRVEPLEVEEAHSSYFEDPERFPPGSVELDCALVMRNLAHEWHGADDLYV